MQTMRSWLKSSTPTRLLAGLAVGGVLLSAGCTRKYYRKQADREVECILTEKNVFPQWGIENWHVYPDGRARFADDSKPDRPRKPSDDPAADALSPNPQSHPHSVGDTIGIGYLSYLENWNAENRARQAELPKLPEPDADDPELRAMRSAVPKFLLTLEQCCELSLFNSREFQDRREDLYVAALPVTRERFNFQPQSFAFSNWIREWTGREVRGGTSGNLWRGDSQTGFSQLFPTGAALLVRLANQVVVDLGNGRTDVSLSRLTVDLAQPFLQGGGLPVTLEALTQSERDLLYAIRSYARFRKVYYVYLAGGDNLGTSLGFTGLGALRNSGNAPSAGYLPTLLIAARERNERANVDRLRKNLDLYKALLEANEQSELQVGQVEQQLLTGKSSLIQLQQTLAQSYDDFKLQLGVPTSLGIELDDAPTNPLRKQLDRFEDVSKQFEDARQEANDGIDRMRRGLLILGGSALGAEPLDLELRATMQRLLAESKLVDGTDFREAIGKRWTSWEIQDANFLKESLAGLRNTRNELLNKKTRLEVDGLKTSPEDEAILERVEKEINLGRMELALRAYEGKAGTPRGERTARGQENLFREAVNSFSLVLGEARDERLDKVKSNWPKLPGVEVDGQDLLKLDLDAAYEVAGAAADRNRLDLMNSRALVVDAWRKVAVFANGLLGVFNVGYSMNTTSPFGGNEPLNLGGSRTTNQLLLSGELPLVRLAERNAYRSALIVYQRQRRQFQEAQDTVRNEVRNDIRNLRVLVERYKIQQRAVQLAFDQVENSQDLLTNPPDPGQRQSAGNAAALTTQLLNNQGNLLRAQNELYNVWISYLIARMQLYRDMELLQLDPRGVWTDDDLSDPSVPGSRGPVPDAIRPAGAMEPAAGRGYPCDQ